MNRTELQQRIKNALQIITEGHYYKVGELTFSCIENEHFAVTGWTISNDLKNITQKSALNELHEIKNQFYEMTIVSSELDNFIKGKEIEYRLGYDYGNGSILICSEFNGQLKWNIELNK